eukprot:COSAG02_NODE_32986_length_507_cov_0.936275_2_plen_114_part_01
MPGHHTINTGVVPTPREMERKRAAPPQRTGSAEVERPAKQHRGDGVVEAVEAPPSWETDDASTVEAAAAPTGSPRQHFCWWTAAQQLVRSAPRAADMLAGPMAQLATVISCPLT